MPMTRAEDEGVPSCICQQCFGRWIAETAMHRRTRLDVEQVQDGRKAGGLDVMRQSLEDLVEIAATADSKMPLRCPTCEKPMTKGRFHQMIPVPIDRCPHCR